MNIYKYQILKYLESKDISIKELKLNSKDELLNKYFNHIDKNELTKYLNKRKQRLSNIAKYKHISEQKIFIDWGNISIWI
jgi:hypothetical protein